MSVVNAFALSLSLSADSFAASLGRDAGAGRARLLRAARTGLVFAAFETAALSAGWGLGEVASGAFRALDHWVALALLAAIGGRMIREGFRAAPQADISPPRPFRLAATALATSIDACAVGASLALAGGGYLVSAVTLATVTFAMTLAGSVLGRRLGAAAGRRAEIAGGLVLVAVGVNIAVTHSLGV
jgi:putative Mn2+ efflux pump MntP